MSNEELIDSKAKKMKALLVFGTRPEAIKMAPIIAEFKQNYAGQWTTVIAVTAQHREMLDQVLDLLEISPEYDLGIMSSRQGLFDITTRILSSLKPILEKEKPDIVLVQGDTTTTMAAALGAFYLKIPVGHVEAGLRTFNKYHPFPEEINRRLTTQLADYHFAPTCQAEKNLLSEGVSPDHIFMTGNTVIDALLQVQKKQTSLTDAGLQLLDPACRIVTVTGHRRENWGKPLEDICLALKEIVSLVSDVEVVFSVHLNPRVRKTVDRTLANNPRIHLLEPLDYAHFVDLLSKSYLILTDSGGVQEEASAFGKPILVLREVTERQEAIDGGVGKLTGSSTEAIVDAAISLLLDRASYDRMAKAINAFGDGRAGKRIVQALSELFSSPAERAGKIAFAMEET